MERHRKSGKQVVENKRRKPVQSRALNTIEVILQATAQILEREGRGALNTNHIAEVAGISVGSLYQYFNNKREILVEIARREIERDRAAVSAAIMKSSEEASEDPARIGIRALIRSQRKQGKVRRAAFDALVAEGLGHLGGESAAALLQVTQLIETRRARLFPKHARPLSEPMLFVISRAVIGAIRSAIIEDSSFLERHEFEDELVYLVRAFFSQPLSSSVR